MSANIIMYSTRYCPYCVAARNLLKSRELVFEDVSVDSDPELRRRMSERAGQRTVPQIWIGETHVGGFTELAALESQGKLDELLAGPPANKRPTD